MITEDHHRTSTDRGTTSGTTSGWATVALVRVALVSPVFPPARGGVETVVEKLASGLPSLGVEVDVITHRPNNRSLQSLQDRSPAPFRVHRYRSFSVRGMKSFSPELFLAIRRRQEEYDIVHVHDIHSTPSLAVGMFCRGPVVLSPYYHGINDSTFTRAFNRAYQPALRKLLGNVRAVTCNSAAEARLFTKDFPNLASRVRFIHLAPDPRIMPERADQLPEVPIMLIISRLVGYKQVDLVLRSIPILETRVQLIVLGEGPERAHLATLANEIHKNGSTVSFVGEASDWVRREWLSRADVLISMSTRESFGLSVVDALAAGARVCVSNIPAHAEIRDMAPSNVRLIEADASPADLANVLEDVLRERGIKTQIPDLPSWGAFLRSTKQCYDDVLRSSLHISPSGQN